MVSVKQLIASVLTATLLSTTVPREVRAADDLSIGKKILITAVITGIVAGILALIDVKHKDTPTAGVNPNLGPGTVDFGTVAGAATKMATLSNPSAQTLRVIAVNVEPAAFEVVEPRAFPIEVLPGRQVNLRVKFQPQDTTLTLGKLQLEGQFVGGRSWTGSVVLKGSGAR